MAFFCIKRMDKRTTTNIAMNAITGPSGFPEPDRRKPGSCRRKKSDRRKHTERRQDPREKQPIRRSFYAWIRSLIRTRLGVDRRKNRDRRMMERRDLNPRSVLTQEELDHLLKKK